MSIVLNGTTGITSTVITETSDGKVGINTNSPNGNLEVKGTSQGQIRVTSNTNEITQIISSSTEASIRAVAAVPLTFRTSNIERMSIDSAGRVTMPYQPCFYAYASSAVNYNDVVRYDAAAVNRGGHYNATSYRFTAPITGAYLFTFSIGRADQGSSADRGIRFRVNGSIIYGYNPANIASTGVYHNHSFSVIRELTAGDFVDIATVTGGGSYSTTGNFFCGHLLG
jgi:hypothetical protein